MDQQQTQLVEYVKLQLSQGVSEHTIRETLLAHNWDIARVNEAFGSLSQTSAPVSGNEPIVASGPASSESKVAKKYTLFKAISDAVEAIRYNPLAYAASAGVVVAFEFVIALITALVYSLVIAAVTVGDMVSPLAGSSVFILTNVVAGIVIGAISLALWSLSLVPIVLAVRDGAEQRKSSIAELFRTSFKRLWRVLLAMLLLWAVISAPFLIIIALLVIMMTVSILPSVDLTGGGSEMFYLVVPVLMAAAVVYMVIAYFRYALVTIIAILEPDLPLKKILKRSSYLLVGGGRWFLVKAILFSGLFLGAVSIFTGDSAIDSNQSTSVVYWFISLIVSLLFGAVMVVLYRNRRAVKDSGSELSK